MLETGATMNQNDDERSGASHEELEHENQLLRARLAELEQLVTADTLTPLYNRRHFFETLDRWCGRVERYGGSYGLVFCDVDRFKLVNDQYGHCAGDAVLVAVANALASAIRKSDIAARVGGDEFAILLDTIDAETVVQKAEAVRALLTELPVEAGDNRFTVSASVGHAVIEKGMTPAQILNIADSAMYLEKRAKYPE